MHADNNQSRDIRLSVTADSLKTQSDYAEDVIETFKRTCPPPPLAGLQADAPEEK